MTRDEQLAVLLANALIDKEEYKQSSTRWFERWEKQKEQLDEFSDAFADLVKELTDANQKLDRYYIAYGKPKQVRA